MAIQYKSVYNRRVGGKKKTKPPMRKPKVPIRYQVADTAYKAYKGAQYLRGLINVERKHFDTNIAMLAGYGGAQYYLNHMVQGSTDITRNGDSILAKSINITGVIKNNSAGLPSTLRLLVIRDNNDTMSTSDLLEYQGTKYVTFAPFKKDKVKRFIVHYDKLFTTDDTNNKYIPFTINLTSLDKHTMYDVGTSNINLNAYKLYIYNSTNVNGPDLDIVTRFTFYDN